MRIRPSGPNFIKTAGSSTVFTCEYISNGEDDGSEPFVWLDNKGEVVGAQNRRLEFGSSYNRGCINLFNNINS